MNSTKNKRSVVRIIVTGLLCFFSFLAFLAFFSAQWYRDVFGDTGFDSILYALFSGIGGMQDGLIHSFLLDAALPAVLWSAGVGLLLYLPRPKKWMPPRPLAHGISLVTGLALLVYAAIHVGMVEYIVNITQLSNLYEYEYVDPDQVQITFPEEKRNLIYIYLESMETSYLSQEQGGAMENNLIPELYELAQQNINFSHNQDVGGLLEVPGASWTVGAMVAQTSGVPLITPIGVSDWQNGYGNEGVFLPGLTSLNNILHDAGYYQALMVGSDANFGGRKTYFQTHGVDVIYDIYTARADGIVPSDYFVWWGMEDLYLFEYAKQELPKIAAQEQPFAFTMLTVDTHHVGGYPCRYCKRTYSENYDNVISCSSRQVLEFVEWIQSQPFYENTTIIISGDHFSMDSGYFSRNAEEDYIRHGYNCFINAAATPSLTIDRQFSSLDMFPTTLAALGCNIPGERLGFGVNLFSDQPTLLEKFGYDAICEELSKRTSYYQKFYKAE